ncbi:MAG TPA: SusD/RagB family nutrient-binding outer membrane lipoprotein [Phnomibacter sp.]|nr:SusD/RagB family nutrient-binding outer membrane lipoprotein [Phnomibacter sp.]
MKRIIYAFCTAAVLLGAGACSKDFYDINENPNAPTEQSISADLIFPRALHATAARMVTSYGDYGGWVGYWTRSGTYGPSTEPESYNITNGFKAEEWSGWYDILTDYNTMEKKAAATGQTFYEGIAKIMKVVGFMYLVDQYNNVPYSKAFDLSGNILPAYDKGSDIYADLLKQVDAGRTLIAGATMDANTNIAKADIMFAGDQVKWRKLANTIHLKLLLRLSQVSTFNPAPEIAKIKTDGSGFIAAGQSANVQPGYAIDNGKQNPFWNSWKKLYTGSEANQYWRANNYVLGKFRTNNDIRYQYFFSAAATPLNGNTYYGYNYGEVIPNTDPKAANSSDVSGPGLARTATQAQWFLTSVESLFLQAEAIQRGWLTGDAQTAYANAVTESFVWLGVTNATATATAYLAQSLPIVNWGAAVTPADKINLIIMQKYLALVGVNNFEAFTDYRRLGVPTDLPLSLAPSRGSNKVPVRLLYPQAEYNYNAVNAKAEGDISAQTSKVFWNK